MKIYYYHTRPIAEALEEWRMRRHPGHILYGLTHFGRNGIGCVLYPYRKISSRLWLMLYTLRAVLLCKEEYDVLYGTSYRGLELVVFLRALGLFRKPVAVWHHQAVPVSHGWLKGKISAFFYKGLDCLFFFSRQLMEDSLQSGKVPPGKMHLVHWGADLEFYDALAGGQGQDAEFISTGKEHRDFETLLEAFSTLHARLDVYSPPANGSVRYEATLDKFRNFPNIRVHYVDGIIPYDLALKVAGAKVVVIPCSDLSYTVGLTTLVEAFALGLPVISTRNPKFEVDIEKEGAGLWAEYKDAESWRSAVRRLQENPDEARLMGRRGRLLAEQTYNLESYTKELSEVLTSLTGE